MTNPHFYWDKWKMLLITGDPKSWRDAIGRLMEWLYANGKFHEKNEALESCCRLVDGKYVLMRHPIFWAVIEQRHKTLDGEIVLPFQEHYKLDKLNEMYASRDHWSYFIQYIKNTRTEEEFADFISKVPRMRGMTLWMKTMKGSKWGEWWFYTLFNPGAYLGNIASNLITWIGRLGPEESIWWWIEQSNNGKVDVNNGTYMQWTLSKWQKKWQRIWVVLTPFYPIQNRGWQLKWLPDSKRKEQQKRILLRRTDRGNIIVRALFGDTHISDFELRSFVETTGDVSGVKLNKSCDRDVRKIHNVKNCYKKLLARRLTNENVKS